MFVYFIPTPSTPTEAKAKYRELAMQHHPDRGGSVATMQAVNGEYAALLADLAHAGERQRADAAHTEGRKVNSDFVDLNQVTESLRQVIEKLLEIPGIDIELCGLWVWITGETKPVKDQIKAQGCRWAPQKEAWYYAGIPSSGRGGFSLETIRNNYGSQKFDRSNQQPRHEDRELAADWSA